MTNHVSAMWWTLALSEEVTDKKPLDVDLGDQPIVLWRDTHGAVRALEDRCPHRRAPLSLGCIRDNGWIQCGYHGWSFEGHAGRLKEIPNMKDDQRFLLSLRLLTGEPEIRGLRPWTQTERFMLQVLGGFRLDVQSPTGGQGSVLLVDRTADALEGKLLGESPGYRLIAVAIQGR